MVEISTSILSVRDEDSIKTFYNLETAKTDYFHIDVMDGKFVENNTSKQMLKFAENIKQISNLPLDVHLMVQDVDRFLEDYIPLQPSFITIHYEAFSNKEDLLKIISKIKQNGIKCGLSIKPNTPIKEIYEYLPFIHMVLIMTVEPGKGGQTLITDMIEKISKLKRYINENDLEVDIEVDGGINLRTAPEVKKAGANILVAGTAILMAKDYKVIVDELRK